MSVRSTFTRVTASVVAALLAVTVLTGTATANQGDGGQVPMRLDRHYSLAKSDYPRANSVRVFNNDTSPGTLTVTDDQGQVIVTKPARAFTQTWLDLPKPKKLFTRYDITATAANGQSVTWPFAVLNLPSDTIHHSAFEPCSTITWAYDDAKAPKNTRRFEADMRKALRVVEQNTGVTFQRTNDPSSADMVITWGSARGHVAMAYPNGEVQFSRSNGRNRDSNAGMRPNGRGWLMVHEVLHILGLSHTKTSDSIMATLFSGQDALSAEDKALLKALYGMHPCPA